MKIIITKVTILFIFFLCINCNAKPSEKQESLIEVAEQTKEYKKVSLKIKTIDYDFATRIILESAEINLSIYYLKNKEISYLKLNQSDDFKPVGFCINTTTLEDAKNQIKLFYRDSFYYLMSPTCTEELPIFHVVKFDNLSYFKDLGIYTFKYDEKLFKLGHFKDIEYNIIERKNKNGISVVGSLSKQNFQLSEITNFENNEQIKANDRNAINEIISEEKNQKQENKNFIGKKFVIDKTNKKGDLFKSKNLNLLFNINNKTYKKGTSYINLDQKYHLEAIKIMNSNLNDYMFTYVLSYNNDILCDTLKIR